VDALFHGAHRPMTWPSRATDMPSAAMARAAGPIPYEPATMVGAKAQSITVTIAGMRLNTPSYEPCVSKYNRPYCTFLAK
jgi:hypothetical protein